MSACGDNMMPFGTLRFERACYMYGMPTGAFPTLAVSLSWWRGQVVLSAVLEILGLNLTLGGKDALF